MEARAIIIVAVVFLFLIGGASFALFKNNFQPASSSVVPSASIVETSSSLAPSVQSSPSAQTQKMSLKDIWSRGSSQKCTFNDLPSKTTGTIYVAQGKMKGDFNSNVANTSTFSHVIVQNQQSYIWVDGQTNGMKIAVNSEQIGKQASSSSQINLDQKYDVSCEGWRLDDSVFNLPQGVNFQDMSSLLQSNTAKPSGTPQLDLKAACGACDKLNGSAKDQCRQALSCQ